MIRPAPLLAAALAAATLLAPPPGASSSADPFASSSGAPPAGHGAALTFAPSAGPVTGLAALAAARRVTGARPEPAAPAVRSGIGSGAGLGAAELELESNDGTYLVTCRVVPADFEVGDLFGLEVLVRRADGEPVAADLAVDARMPEHGHGMNREPVVEARGEGRFEASNLMFHMPGYWELYLDLTRGAVTERAQAPLELE